MKQATALKILKSGKNVFLTGSAGTGKTFVLNKYIEYLKERGIEPAIVAPTGIAASHIGGKTIHSFFSVGIREYIDDYYLRWMKKQLFLDRRLRKLKVLIVDEISMVSPELFISMDRILRAFQNEEKPFGGVQVVFSGDFFQLPPVAKVAKAIKFVWQTDLWKEADLKICYLEEKFRQEEDNALVNILDEIRLGEVSEDSMNVFRSCYKKRISSEFTVTKLYTHNMDVDRINDEELDKLPGEVKSFEAKTKGSKQNIEKIFKSSLVAPQIKLKKEAAVIFIKNNYEEGYINGTLGKVVSFDRVTKLPIVETLSKKKILVEPEEWLLEDDQGKVKAIVKQLPLKLAWALTVHKSQGMTLDAAEIDLSKTFEIGQGYVALSRIKSIEGLRLMGLNDVALRVDEMVREIDKDMKMESRLNFREFEDLEEEIFLEISEKFILENGGEIESEKIKENIEKNKEKKEAPRVDKRNKGETLMLTKKMLSEKKTISQIAKERGFAERTILDHLGQIKELFPETDFEHLKPQSDILRSVLDKADEIRKKNNPEDFLPNGQIKLRPIFEGLSEKISYEDIKLAMLFLGK